MGWMNGTLQPTRPLTKVEREMARREVQAEQDLIAAKAKEADARDDREQREKRAAREAERRERAATEVAVMRADIERDLRLSGAPTADIGRLAGEAVARYFRDRAAAAVPDVERTANELRAARRGPARQDVIPA